MPNVWSKTQDLQELTHYLKSCSLPQEAIFCTISALQWNNFCLCDPKPSPGQAVHMQATAKLAREPFHRKLESFGNFRLQEGNYHAIPLWTHTSFFSPLTCPSCERLLAEAAGAPPSHACPHPAWHQAQQGNHPQAGTETLCRRCCLT